MHFFIYIYIVMVIFVITIITFLLDNYSTGSKTEYIVDIFEVMFFFWCIGETELIVSHGGIMKAMYNGQDALG